MSPRGGGGTDARLRAEAIERLAPLNPAPTRLEKWWWRYGLPCVALGLAIPTSLRGVPQRPPGITFATIWVWLAIFAVAAFGARMGEPHAGVVTATLGGVYITISFAWWAAEPMAPAGLLWLGLQLVIAIAACGVGLRSIRRR